MKRARSKASTNTFDVDIGQEFKDVKSSIQALRVDLGEWKNIFNTQLTKLNDNMHSVLERIADHEQRLTVLETKNIQFETKTQTLSEAAKVGWFFAKFILGAGIVIGGILGTAKAWSIIFPA